MPGETLAEKVVSLAQKLGGVFDGFRWRFPSQDILRTIRRAATAWGVCPPEPLAEPTDPAWEAEIRQEEIRRRVEAQERVETRFSWAAANGGRQALLDGQGQLVARLAEADLATTPETLAWIAGLPPDLEIFPVEARILPSAIEAAEAGAKAAVRGSIRGRSKHAALAEKPLDLTTPVAGVVLPPAIKEEALQGLTPQVHQRAEIKCQLVRLWKTRCSENFPEECARSNGRWAKLAWLTFVGFALPPVFTDARRWEGLDDTDEQWSNAPRTSRSAAGSWEGAR